MIFDDQDASFIDTARDWLRSLEADDLVIFERVLELSPGYYPTTIYAVWMDELAARGLARRDPPLPLLEFARLPVGHPADYDWRFTAATRRALLSRLIDGRVEGDVLAYLGAPTLFAEGVEQAPQYGHLLVDANESMVDAVGRHASRREILPIRIGEDDVPRREDVAAVMMDPPWYPTDSLNFLAAASALAREGAPILLSQPTYATRPGVISERTALIEAAMALGLAFQHELDEPARYETPHFERMSLGEENPLVPVPADWRTGDVLLFKKTGPAPERWPAAAPSRLEWVEATFGPVRIKLRNSGEPDLALLEPELDRLLTVSRRDPARARVGLWTSGNRVRTLSNVDAIARCIALCDNDLSMTRFSHSSTEAHAAELALDQRVATDLFELLLLEYQEHVAAGFGVTA
ncbi:hypothetical protein [Mesorhizobium japonicum]|uniref:hypothetical protein n=1 Tax=Mesorhizobium japonicum TaxID=2066070 RepID=UPI003B5A320F